MSISDPKRHYIPGQSASVYEIITTASAVSSTDRMVDTQLCNLRTGTSGSFVLWFHFFFKTNTSAARESDRFTWLILSFASCGVRRAHSGDVGWLDFTRPHRMYYTVL